ncbi:MAG: 4Fe-4S dicluster domain-containing protein [Chloroflexi bacterium]|nr:4Fe-4S dicluster domain-containing protein [Chloroflexota bacterium]
MTRRLVLKLFSSSAVALFREGRRAGKVSLTEMIHGYIYARWIYLYIDTGLGNSRLARIVGPVFKRLTALLPSRPPQKIHGETGTLADSYHGKVITLDVATQFVSVEKDISLTDLEHIIPFEKARDIVLKDPDHIAVLECPCRSSRAEPCLPVDVCLVVGEPFASFVAEHHPKRSRTISPKEAVSILEAEHERGHVHHAYFKDAMLGRFYAICNCCSCCCGAMQATRNGIPMIIHSGYLSEVDAELCIGCGACREYCQFDALNLGYGYTMVLDHERCMGCGVCVDQCDFEAMALRLAPEKGIPLEIDRLMHEALNVTGAK